MARRWLALGIAAVTGGCAPVTGVTPAPPPIAGSTLTARPETHFYGYDFLYASQAADNDVVVYKQKKKKKNRLTLTLFQTLSSGFSTPMGMVATPAGRLYVANSGASNVLVYRSTRQGPVGPVETLDDPGQIPVNVAVSQDRRVVAVSNESTTGSGAGSVSVYLKKAAQPSRVLTYGSDPIRGAGIAIDAAGNCFWSFNDPATLSGSIVEFAGCKGPGVPFKSGILKAGGLAFDASGNLYYVDRVAGIFKCTPGLSCQLFVSLGGMLGLILPTNINFDNRNPSNLWVSDAGGYIDALNLQGLIVYVLQAVGGVLDPPVGIAPAPGD